MATLESGVKYLARGFGLEDLNMVEWDRHGCRVGRKVSSRTGARRWPISRQ